MIFSVSSQLKRFGVATADLHFDINKFRADQARNRMGQFAPEGGGSSTFSDAEKQSLKSYVATEYRGINSMCRTDKNILGATEEILQRRRQMIGHLDNIIEKTALTDTPQTVYRGVKGSAAAKIRDAAIGSTLSDPAFVSTSLSRSVASGFGEFYNNSVILKIDIPVGAKALNVNEFFVKRSPHSVEEEILLPRNAKFEVLSQEVAESGYVQVNVKVVG